jgi:hypothetical protein
MDQYIIDNTDDGSATRTSCLRQNLKAPMRLTLSAEWPSIPHVARNTRQPGPQKGTAHKPFSSPSTPAFGLGIAVSAPGLIFPMGSRFTAVQI